MPKAFLPNYREYYEKRWFSPGRAASATRSRSPAAGALRRRSPVRGVGPCRASCFTSRFARTCGRRSPPSSDGALAGATILANLSASNIVIGKADDRHLLCRSQSQRGVAAYAYSAAGPGESTTDLAWDGQGAIYELGDLLAEAERFSLEPQLAIADVDTGRILSERMRHPHLRRNAADHAGCGPARLPLDRASPMSRPSRMSACMRRSAAFPTCRTARATSTSTATRPSTSRWRACARRFEATGGGSMVIGVSGGLDSTHALIVAAKVCDRLGLPREKILAFTMPGFATSEATKANAWR